MPVTFSLPDTEPASTCAVAGMLRLLFFVPTWGVECLLGGVAVGAVRWARAR